MTTPNKWSDVGVLKSRDMINHLIDQYEDKCIENERIKQRLYKYHCIENEVDELINGGSKEEIVNSVEVYDFKIKVMPVINKQEKNETNI